jgi:hypothetical protein
VEDVFFFLVMEFAGCCESDSSDGGLLLISVPYH